MDMRGTDISPWPYYNTFKEAEEMALIAKQPESGEFEKEIIPAGMHQGICYSVIDLGTHISQTYGNSQRKVLITWEFPEIRIEYEKDGEQVNLPRVISKELTLSLHEKAGLRAMLETWRGKGFTPDELAGFDIFTVLGVNALIQIIHNPSKKDANKIYANVSAVMPLMKGTEKLEPENPIQKFSFQDNMAIPDGLPDFIIGKIYASKEYQERDLPDNDFASETIPEDAYGDDIPF